MDFSSLNLLAEGLQGELVGDELTRIIYATDASVYRKKPRAVAYPKNQDDIQKLVRFASQKGVGLIPRTAGTSLAGQCVGEGIIVDVSRHLTEILKIDSEKKQVTVQPGVVRDELNAVLKPYGLFFGPNTSTSNRCMMGGMVGNNSSGTTSIKYGVTRDKIVAIQGILSDGSVAIFKDLDSKSLEDKLKLQNLEGEIYKTLDSLFTDSEIQQAILDEFPKPEIHRRNTGYALDSVTSFTKYGGKDPLLNLGKLISGSEGTLFFMTEITLQLDYLPPPHAAMIVPHYTELAACLNDVVKVMQHDLFLCEMMDKIILDCTKDNRTQLPNRFFIEGDPEAVLMLELRADTQDALKNQIEQLQHTLENTRMAYAQPVLYGEDIQKAITLRKAGLGLLGNMVGDKKAVACIEDTAVAIEDLSDYIAKFTGIMSQHGQKAVYYAHAGAGELHLRPILDLKSAEDVNLFREITTQVAELVKSYRGSFSGEHGDGIVRAEFVEYMVGPLNYKTMQKIKMAFDPKGIFNPGKIVDPYPMDQSLRYEPDRSEPEIETFMDFSEDLGILRSAEKCNGSGDCRKSHLMAGGMCPSYQATKDEKDTTRARANALREVLTHSEKHNRFDSEELKAVFDLCLSCKACASECPSNVDVASLKAEFQYQYNRQNGTKFRDRLFAHSGDLNRKGSRWAFLVNVLHRGRLTGNLAKWIYGVAQDRKLPSISSFNFDKYLQNKQNQNNTGKEVALFLDEFTAYMDTSIGKDAIDLLHGLNYRLNLLVGDSGRSLLSKGFLSKAKRKAEKLLDQLTNVGDSVPIVGIEPSAILTLRDEMGRFGLDKKRTENIANRSFLLEEFLSAEADSGSLTATKFIKTPRTIHVHGHCHQKALSDMDCTQKLLSIPENYEVKLIPSGCCGMAGSFGYEKEHYPVSMDIGELVLFPYIRDLPKEALVAANGTSCRHQILDGTTRVAKHPLTLMKEALLVD